MSIRLRRPSEQQLRELLAASASAPLTYGGVGCSLDATLGSDGMTRRAWHIDIARADAFDLAVGGLRRWDVHRGAGLIVLPDRDVAIGCNVAMSASLPIGHVDIACRVVAVIEEADRFGFAYGTLPVHPERGEESFVIERTDAGMRFGITAVSRPAHPLARLAPPIANRLQASATARYLAAMTSIAMRDRRQP